jgi:hypothetical protein
MAIRAVVPVLYYLSGVAEVQVMVDYRNWPRRLTQSV